MTDKPDQPNSVFKTTLTQDEMKEYHHILCDVMHKIYERIPKDGFIHTPAIFGKIVGYTVSQQLIMNDIQNKKNNSVHLSDMNETATDIISSMMKNAVCEAVHQIKQYHEKES